MVPAAVFLSDMLEVVVEEDIVEWEKIGHLKDGDAMEEQRESRQQLFDRLGCREEDREEYHQCLVVKDTVWPQVSPGSQYQAGQLLSQCEPGMLSLIITFIYFGK